MASFQTKSDPKQVSIILNIVKLDCCDLYKAFCAKKTQLKHAIELYEEFMTEEINTLFQCSNKFSEIVLNHRKNFNAFIDEAKTTIVEQNVFVPDDSVYVLFISLQEWLLQGSKGQQFYFIIDIDSFNYTQFMDFQRFAVNLPKVLIRLRCDILRNWLTIHFTDGRKSHDCIENGQNVCNRFCTWDLRRIQTR